MKLQQWGTFSVKDHLKARAFVAEVLLFDKLVIPRPATAEEMKAEGQDVPIEDQTARWHRKKWYPDRQRDLLNVLNEGGLAIEVPWGKQAQGDWAKVYNKPESDQLECDRANLTQSIRDQVELAKSTIPEEAAYLATGGALALYVAGAMQNKVARQLINLARTPGVPIEAVIAYGSYAAFTDDQGVQDVEHDFPPVAELAPYAMFGWEFFVPEDSEKSDTQLLREAVTLASRKDFREHREYFNGWLKQMYEGQVDRQDALDSILKALTEYTKIIRGSWPNTVARYAAKAAPVLAPLAGLAGHTLGVGVEVAASGAALTVDWLLPKPQMPDRLRHAAVLYDAKRFFRKH